MPDFQKIQRDVPVLEKFPKFKDGKDAIEVFNHKEWVLDDPAIARRAAEAYLGVIEVQVEQVRAFIQQLDRPSTQ